MSSSSSRPSYVDPLSVAGLGLLVGVASYSAYSYFHYSSKKTFSTGLSSDTSELSRAEAVKQIATVVSARIAPVVRALETAERRFISRDHPAESTSETSPEAKSRLRDARLHTREEDNERLTEFVIPALARREVARIEASVCAEPGRSLTVEQYRAAIRRYELIDFRSAGGVSAKAVDDLAKEIQALRRAQKSLIAPLLLTKPKTLQCIREIGDQWLTSVERLVKARLDRFYEAKRFAILAECFLDTEEEEEKEDAGDDDEEEEDEEEEEEVAGQSKTASGGTAQSSRKKAKAIRRVRMQGTFNAILNSTRTQLAEKLECMLLEQALHQTPEDIHDWLLPYNLDSAKQRDSSGKPIETFATVQDVFHFLAGRKHFKEYEGKGLLEDLAVKEPSPKSRLFTVVMRSCQMHAGLKEGILKEMYTQDRIGDVMTSRIAELRTIAPFGMLQDKVSCGSTSVSVVARALRAGSSIVPAITIGLTVPGITRAVILLPGSYGIDATLMAHARLICSRGYKVVIPELGDFHVGKTPHEAEDLYDSMTKLNDPSEMARTLVLNRALQDIEACAKHLKAPPSQGGPSYGIEKVYVVGFELGGALASCVAVKTREGRGLIEGVVSFFDPALSMVDVRSSPPRSISVTSLVVPPLAPFPLIVRSLPLTRFCGHCGFKEQEPLLAEYRSKMGDLPFDDRTQTFAFPPPPPSGPPGANSRSTATSALHVYSLFNAADLLSKPTSSAENADLQKAWDRTFAFLRA